ncbi:MAG: RodZ domain-containing protein [Betaproteobacteria bacterium]
MRELGELLREAREARGLTISDVREATKIRARYLEAIERGEFEVLPGEAYVKGFLRNYAEAVGLSGDEIVGRYKAERAKLEEERAQDAPPGERRNMSQNIRISRRFLAALGFGALLVLVVAVALWGRGHVPAGPAPDVPAPEEGPAAPSSPAADVVAGDGAAVAKAGVSAEARPGERPSGIGPDETEMTASQPAPEASPTPSSAPGTEQESAEAHEGHELSVSITERCWVRVVADGKVVFERSMVAGEQATWHAKKSIRIKVGNASGIDVTYNGLRIGPLGKSGQVVERVFPQD